MKNMWEKLTRQDLIERVIALENQLSIEQDTDNIDLKRCQEANRTCIAKIEELRAKLADRPLTMKQVAELIMNLNAMGES